MDDHTDVPGIARRRSRPRSGTEPPALPVSLAAAARLLEQLGELLPLTVTCDQATRVLPPVTVTPASLAMPPGQP